LHAHKQAFPKGALTIVKRYIFASELSWSVGTLVFGAFDARPGTPDPL
jgi:hypothetical protein